MAVLKAVVDSRQGWVPDVEPYLQSHAVAEYENDDLWLDLRYVLKSYVRELAGAASPAHAVGTAGWRGWWAGAHPTILVRPESGIIQGIGGVR